ncbi:hypothetical protein Tco_0307620 [Tanacetum coccineum]
MSSITAQQTKLDLELVPKENRLDIGKCNGRIPRGLTPREPTFQVILDAIALTPYSSLTRRNNSNLLWKSSEIYFKFAQEYLMHQPWRTFATLINRGLTGKSSGLDKLCLSRAQILWGAVPPKMARKFKKASPSKKDSDLVPIDEEPVQKGKRVKRPTKKSTTKQTAGVIIREALMETKSKSKEKEKVKKSLRDFHKTHPSSSGTVAKKPQSVDKITATVTSEGTGDKPGVPDLTEDDSIESEYESWGNDEDDNNNKQESSNEGSEQENKSDEQESDSEQEEEYEDDDQEEEEFGMDDTTYQFDDDVDARLKEPTQTDKEVVQETTQEQVVEDAHVTISTVTKKTEVPVTSSSRSSDLASKFLNFSDIPHADAEIVSPLDVHVHHEVPRTQAPTLLTIPISVITESSPVYINIPQSSQTFTPPPILTTPNPPPTIKTTNPLSTLPDFALVF